MKTQRFGPLQVVEYMIDSFTNGQKIKIPSSPKSLKSNNEMIQNKFPKMIDMKWAAN